LGSETNLTDSSLMTEDEGKQHLMPALAVVDKSNKEDNLLDSPEKNIDFHSRPQD